MLAALLCSRINNQLEALAVSRKKSTGLNSRALFFIVGLLVGCFFFNDTATTEIYTLSLHDALPIYEETEGFLSYRIADRRGHHSDHRGHRYSEFAQGQDGGERILSGWCDSYSQHRSGQLLDFVSSGRLRRYFGRSWWSRSGMRSSGPQHDSASLPRRRTSLW